MSVTELTVSSTIEVNGRKVQVVAMLGRGAIGVSYQVRQDDGTQQVLKIFDPRYGEIFKQRVHQFRESRFTSSDSVIGYIDAGFIKDQPYILHEHVQAKTFDETARTSKFDPKKPQAAVDIGVKLCQAVATIHGYEIIHGHLWNGNVFFNVYGDPVFVDPFIGAPTPADVSSGIASASHLSLYLAPEQKDINGFIDPRTDIWHIGALLCRLYTGKPDLAVNELCLRELYKAKVPLSLIRVLWQAIQKNWHSRYPDIATFETALCEAFEPEHRKTVYLKPLPYASGASNGMSRSLKNLLLGVGSAGCLIFISMQFFDTVPSPTKVTPASPVVVEKTPEKVIQNTTWFEEPGRKYMAVDLGNGIVTRLVNVPAGVFLMGSPKTELGRKAHEGPQHTVSLSEFWIGEAEVTVAEFNQFVLATNYKTAAEIKGTGWGCKPNGGWGWIPGLTWKTITKSNIAAGRSQTIIATPFRPVVVLAFEDCRAFYKWLSLYTGLNVQLPTEAQWEYACRAGTTTAFAYGNKVPANWPADLGELHPVRSYQPNGWGIYGMHGNAWEWCSDWYAPYTGSNNIDPTGPGSGSKRVTRSGTYFKDLQHRTRSAARSSVPPDHRVSDVGFRIVANRYD